MFQDLTTLCLFIGCPRSCHSIVAAVLDAHPNIVIAHDLDALTPLFPMPPTSPHRVWLTTQRGCQFIELRINSGQCLREIKKAEDLYNIILKESQETAVKKIRGINSGYTYVINNLWQGRHTELKIIGDSFLGIRANEEIIVLDQVQKISNLKLKLIHVFRNSFDNITTMTKRIIQGHNEKYKSEKPIDTSSALSTALNEYFMLTDVTENIRKTYDVFDIKSEEFIANPRSWLKKLCAWLEVEAPKLWLEASESIVYRESHLTRFDIEWTPEQKAFVMEKMSEHDFLKGYLFDN